MTTDLPKLSDFESVEEIDIELEQTEQQLEECQQNIDKLLSAIADTKRRHGISTESAFYQQKLDEFLHHKDLVEQHEEEYNQARRKLSLHFKAVSIVPEWNQWVRACGNNQQAPIHLSTSELNFVISLLKQQVKNLDQGWNTILEYHRLLQAQAKIIQNISAIESQSQQLYDQRKVSNNSVTKLDLDRQILANRDKIYKLEQQHQFIGEQLQDEEKFSSPPLSLAEAEQKRKLYTRKIKQLTPQNHGLSLLQLNENKASYGPQVSYEQAEREWLDALEQSSFGNVAEFLQALLTPETLQHLEAITDEYLNRLCDISAKVWTMTMLVDLDLVLQQQLQHQQDLCLTYAALEQLQRRFYRCKAPANSPTKRSAGPAQ